MRENDLHTGSAENLSKSAENFTREELERLARETGEVPADGAISALAQKMGQNVERMLTTDAGGNQ